MKLLQLQLYPVYEIPEQIRRRIAFNAGTEDLTKLSDVIVQNGSSATSAFDYGEAMGKIVGFDPLPGSFETPVLDISGQSNVVTPFRFEQRSRIYNFVAVVVVNPINETRSQEIRYILTGYTSEADPTLASLLPDDMVLYINDIYGVRLSYKYDSLGNRYVDPNSFQMVDNYVLSNTLVTSQGTELTLDPIALTKAAKTVSNLDVNVGAGEELQFNVTSDQVLGPSLQSEAQLLTAQLTRPESFIGAMSTGYLNSLLNEQESNSLSGINAFFDNGTLSLEGEMRRLGVVKSYKNHNFANALRTALSRQNFVQDAYRQSQDAKFRLGDLRSVLFNPQDLNRMLQDSLSTAMRNMSLGIDKTDSWTNMRGIGTDASLIAYDVGMRMGQVMAKNLINGIRLTFDNRMANFDTQPQLAVVPDSAESVSEGGIPALMARNFMREMMQTFIQATRHNAVRCKMVVISRLGQVTRVEITPDGEAVTEYYTFASFMSSRMHIGLTYDNTYNNTVAKNTSTLFSTIQHGFDEYTRRDSSNAVMVSMSAMSSPSNGFTIPDTPVSQPASSGDFSFGNDVTGFKL
ncbi:hypothetical protein HOV30_gp033 [Erwinia phage Derbicus]|uniref:Uncharacterized protein n=2 Tax=Derbicusvirus derbicus TaxID=2734104 RepID=A0A482IJX0_9CAUD|nr:hypothetical protein BIZ82_gp033 [Erwinia phage vB_EamM_EarlPhillipIV]YP_009821077.1 hypothetical protein HOV30_gp033 [Erwinia phage Derbicus]ANZ48883.1 hypothetical protein EARLPHILLIPIV_33 [Erwinia phage vB_EamM_EarlPhillipIV]QBP07459.1 hypothetical protein DERBICUS_33 [Erwinia phage Derbicus]QXO09754.1 hypothetical protein pEaSNUABM38_00032 [Erwinia phage pEa_SNUABM_38]